ncbi:MAG TPA: HAMP domain-containing histidine kinase, partial [Henriciella marina]|nr:HAMP domain-containing histidine kinase [Henriciella marina]
RHTGDSIAHDLRSPLSRLRNRLETALLGEMNTETARETLAHTVEEVDRVLATFNAILRLSRLDAGAEGRLVRFDMREMLLELADLYEPACEDAGLKFESEIGHNLFVLGDRELLAQAISNLLDNAIKYTPENGSITLKAIRSPDHIIVEVSDTGPGIAEDMRERAKERFFRLDEARTQSGSGLGLALVDSVADLHKGEIDLLWAHEGPEPFGLKTVFSLPRER